MKIAITGAATGIGASVAQKLNAKGAAITGFDIVEPTANIDTWIPVDLSDPDAIRDAAQKAGTGFDTLINCAGLPPRDGLAVKLLAVNVLGLIQFTNAMLDQLAPSASIVNVASRAGAAWRDNLDQIKALLALDTSSEIADMVVAHNIDPTRAYRLSKEAVIVWTMAKCETMLARGVRMNSVSPAAVSTGILSDFMTAFGPAVAANVQRVGRAGTADEIADLIVFLASDESHWIKGQDIVIDGGMSALLTSDTLGL